MSDRPPPAQVGIVAAAERIGTALVNSLPPAFLGLCLINVIFVASVFWYESRQLEARVLFATRIMDACVPLIHSRP